MECLKPFDVWLAESSLAKSTQRDYYRALEGRISEWARRAKIISESILDITDASDFRRLQPRIEAMKIFRERNSKEKYRFSAAMKRFSDYLEDGNAKIPATQAEEIQKRSDIPETQKIALINARMGQGKFRREILRRWESCALFGVQDPIFLVASHIKPWAASTDHERLDPFNGLLLSTHADRAFDTGRITFNEDGSILISKEFRDAKLLGFHTDMGIPVESNYAPFLKYHRQFVYNRGQG